MKKTIVFFVLIILGNSCLLAQSFLNKQRVALPNGWFLSNIGKNITLGDLPLNVIVSPNKKYLAVTNNGQSIQSIELVDVNTEKVLDNYVVKKSWYGLKFSADSKELYASGGNDNDIIKFSIINNHLKPIDTFILGNPWPNKISPTGFDLDEKTNRLFIVTKENNSLYVFNTKDEIIEHQLSLPDAGYTCLLAKDKKLLYISCWGCDKVLIYNISKNEISKSIDVGDNPNEMILSKNGKYLFVCNSNDNSVSIIDTKQETVIETLNAALYPNAPSGSTTNGLALSEDERTLFIANADNNCLEVFNVSTPGKSISIGYIPTGWYPTSIKVIGNKLFVTNGKGLSSKANPNGPNPTFKKENYNYQKGDSTKTIKVAYIAGLFEGTLSIISIPTKEKLSIYSKMVYDNTPYSKIKENNPNGEKNNPIPTHVGMKSPIKYVFYIIKENRTYDQVLGDINQGNGDTNLVLFGSHCTPNQHALVNQFVLVDNFYTDGEVSADGHNWSTGAYATDYLEKTWPTSYGGRGGGYDAEGNRSIANNKNGFIWDLCKRNGVSYRSYGEFADDYKPNIPVLTNHICNYYTGWDPKIRDTVRFNQWKRDFDSLLAAHAVPQLNTLRFPNDHTEGMRKNRPSPYAHVADNDLATGMFVDYLSHSSIWDESVVFVLEDDAQNGPDHVDAHRSTLYIAGGKVKENFIDHNMYSTSSVLRTIELILGLPPMTQYDAAAEPLWRCFTDSFSHPVFNYLPNNVDLDEKNVAINEWQKRSEKFDFAHEDRVPDMELNKVLWYGLKGAKNKMPSPKRAAFLRINEKPIEKD